MITILQTHQGQLTKAFTRLEDGTVAKSDYDNAQRFRAIEAEPKDIFELSALLTELEAWTDACVVRAQVRSDANPDDINRRKLEDPTRDAPSLEKRPDGVWWVMCDFDKVPAPAGLTTNQERLDHLVSMLPEAFHGVTYHYHWSSSQGLKGWESLSCHLWFWLTRPHDDDLLCERHHVEGWDCDDAAFRTVQPLYTANPIFVNFDDVLDGERSGLIRGDRDDVDLPEYVPPPPPKFPDGTPMPFVRSPSFQDRLDAIGPRLHQPILQAIASYVARHGWETDEAELMSILQDAIWDCGPTFSDKRDYMSDRYLRRAISGAVRKYGHTEPSKQVRLERKFAYLKRKQK